jgi:hypothetical protein
MCCRYSEIDQGSGKFACKTAKVTYYSHNGRMTQSLEQEYPSHEIDGYRFWRILPSVRGAAFTQDSGLDSQRLMERAHFTRNKNSSLYIYLREEYWLRSYPAVRLSAE